MENIHYVATIISKNGPLDMDYWMSSTDAPKFPNLDSHMYTNIGLTGLLSWLSLIPSLTIQYYLNPYTMNFISGFINNNMIVTGLNLLSHLVLLRFLCITRYTQQIIFPMIGKFHLTQPQKNYFSNTDM